MAFYDPGVERLDELSQEDPRLRLGGLLLLWRKGVVTRIPELLDWSRRSLVHPSPWLAPVVRRLSYEFSVPRICSVGIPGGDLWALKAAAQIKDVRLVEAIQSAIEHRGFGPDPRGRDLRADYVWTLGEIGDRRALPFLLKELREGNYWSVPDAVEALGKLGDASVVPILLERVPLENSLTQASIFLVLARMGTEEALPILEWYADSQEYTGAIARRSCAQKAIEEIRRRRGQSPK